MLKSKFDPNGLTNPAMLKWSYKQGLQ